MKDWKQNTVFKSNVIVDIAFTVRPTFYYGPANNFTEDEYTRLRVPLYQPDIKMSDQAVLTRDVKGKEFQLLRHYSEVVKNCSKYNEAPIETTYFWNRPVIYSPDDFKIVFPWYDHFREGRAVLEILMTNSNGEIYWDRDQCWELEIYGSNNLVYAKQWNPDDNELHLQVNFSWAPIREQARELISQTQELISYLSNALGHDYWT